MCALIKNAKAIIVCVFCLVAIAIIPNSSWSRIIHVAPTGSDATGDGSAGNPYYSINRAQLPASGIQPGDTVFIHGGTYYPTTSGWGVINNAIGTSDAWITFTGDPEDIPVLDFTFGGASGIWASRGSPPSGSPPNSVTNQYFRIQYLHIQNASHNGMNITDNGEWLPYNPSHNVEISHITFKDIGRVALKMAGIDSFHVHNINITDAFWGWSSGHPYGGTAIDNVGCHDGLIENCHIEWITGIGKIDHSDSWQTAFMIKGGSRDIIIRNNYIRNAYVACLAGQVTGWDFFRPRFGTLDADGETTNYEAKRITYYANLIVDAAHAIQFYHSTQCKFYHNTVYLRNHHGGGIYPYTMRPIEVSIHITSPDPSTGISKMMDEYGEVKNNIIVFGKNSRWYQCDGVIAVRPWGSFWNRFTTFEIWNNLFYSTYCGDNGCGDGRAGGNQCDNSAPRWDVPDDRDGPPDHRNNIEGLGFDNRWCVVGSMDGITLWVNHAELDLRLAEGSAAIHAGISLYPFVTHDFSGNPYNYESPSLGAFEFSANGENPHPLSAPSDPYTLPWPAPGRRAD